VRNPPASLLRFLKAYDPEITRLFVATRGAVLADAPQANEFVYDAYNAVAAAYTLTDRLKEAFCHIAAYRGYVNLGFNRGTSLPDPDRVLAGSGRQVRHVRIAVSDDLERPAVRRLIRAAVEEARALTPSARPEARSTVRGAYPNKRRPAPAKGAAERTSSVKKRGASAKRKRPQRSSRAAR
jgi:hypothetical protein